MSYYDVCVAPYPTREEISNPPFLFSSCTVVTVHTYGRTGTVRWLYVRTYSEQFVFQTSQERLASR